MSCKRHPSSQGPGVCASCLRDRLLSLLVDRSPTTSPPSPPILFSDEGGGARARARGRFSLSRLFGHRRRSEDAKSRSWINGLFRSHRRERRSRAAAAAAAEDDCLPGRASAPYPARARGMSPAATGEDESDSGTESGYSTSTSTASSGPIRRGAPPHHRRRRDRGFSAVWLNPLAPPRPQWERRQAAEGAAAEFSGDLRSGVAGGGAAPRWANRSRKLADVGRFR